MHPIPGSASSTSKPFVTWAGSKLRLLPQLLPLLQRMPTTAPGMTVMRRCTLRPLRIGSRVMVVNTGPSIRYITKDRCRLNLELAVPARNSQWSKEKTVDQRHFSSANVN
jgi:hypothetical protein